MCRCSRDHGNYHRIKWCEWRKSRRQCFAEQFVWNRWIWISVCRIGDYNDSNYSDSYNSGTGDICGKSSGSRRKRFFVLNKTENPTVGTIFDAFRSGHYVNVVLAMFLKNLFTSLWTLLFVIPGIVKHYEYLMIPYILAENPGMDRKEAFQISKRMMDGQKMETFILDLSFIGWILLSAITCGIVGIFYVNPYREATFAELYAFNKAKAYEEGYIR